MPCLENCVYIIVGEMNMVITAMKRSNRWSSHVQQDEELNSLLQNFHSLKDTINSLCNSMELDPIVYLSPFLDVIRSENTSGLVTGHGLSAIHKFLSLGLINSKCPNAAVAAEHIADAVTHARFMMIDASSDEIVLMRIIQVLRILLVSPIGVLLTNESVCEIIQSFFRMCFETRFSEILRKTAEAAVVDTVQLLFFSLPQFTDDNRCTNIKKLKMHSTGLNKNHYARRIHNLIRYRKKVCHNSNPISFDQISENITLTNGSSNISSSGTLTKQDFDHSCITTVESELIGCNTMTEEGVMSFDSNIQRDLVIESSVLSERNSDLQDKIAFADTYEVCESPSNYCEDMLVDSASFSEPCILALDNDAKLCTIDLKIGEKEPHVDESRKCTYLQMGKLNVQVTDETSDNVYHDENDYVNPHGVRFTPQQPLQEGTGPLMPYGLPCVRELFRLLLSLVNPFDRHNTDVTIQIGLNLLTIALETGADNLGKFNSLLQLVKDEMCRNLFSLLSTERLTIFTTALRVFFLLFEALRTHLKFQLEMFLSNLMDLIVSESPKVSYEQREISLDCLTQLWRVPGFVTELYINYDSDLYCSNLFESLTKLLSKNAFPLSGLYSVHLLSLDALLAVIDNIEIHCNIRMRSKEERSSELDSTDDIGDPDSMLTTTVQQGMSGYHFGQKLLLLNHAVAEKSSENSKEIRSLIIQPNRMKVSSNIPSHEELMAIKHKKKILASGTEQFNSQPIKGIMFLQEHGLLNKILDTNEVAAFLRDNPRLDKKMIGEYISNRKNLKVLEAFVKSFTFEETRIDEALRQYLETFRLPGEAPLISLIMEHFAEHWHNSNNQPFANNDAAFTLAYAIIMLNVDQHNHNVKKQNNPMTFEDFKKNLKNVNGGKDFDDEMLEKIYTSIRNEEIIMPAEQTGLVRENYLWKVLLKRGDSKEGKFIHTPNGVFDHDLFLLAWGPTVAALSFIFDKTTDLNIIEKAISGFHKCAMIAAHYGMCDVFDNLVISLCKFTLLVNSENPKLLPVVFGNNVKAQMATKSVFKLVHCHGDILREGWKNLLDCVLHLFKAKLLPEKLVLAEDFLSPDGVISLMHEDLPNIPRTESGLFSSFYSYITLESPSQRLPSQEDEIAKKTAKDCIEECHCEQLFDETKFLRIDSLQELVKTLIFLCPRPEPSGLSSSSIDEESAVFILELLIKIVLLNRDRVVSIWSGIRDHMFSIIMNSAVTDNVYLLERTVVGILRIAVRLICKEEMIPQVLQSLRVLLYLKAPALVLTSRQVAYALNDLLKTNAANIHDEEQWSIIFSLLERVGAGAKPPRSPMSLEVICTDNNSICVCHKTLNDNAAQSDSELSKSRHAQDSVFVSEKGYTSDGELYENPNLNPRLSLSHKKNVPQIGTNFTQFGPGGDSSSSNQYNISLYEELSFHDSLAFLKCCESLAFLVRDAAHITSENFESCVHCLRTFVEASANGAEKKLHNSKLIRAKKWQKSPSIKKKEAKGKKNRSQHRSEDYDADDEEKTDEREYLPAYQQASMQLLDLMHTLHTRASSIYSDEVVSSNNMSCCSVKRNLWSKCWCPLLQGIARLCCDNRLEIRTSALSLLQRALLVHDLQTLIASEWEACFNKVLFPLLAKLLENISPSDQFGMEETRTRGANLLCKVFLQHLTPLLTLSTFLALWLTILDFMEKYMSADFTGSLAEAIPESLKNMLLVMDTAGVFQKPEGFNLGDQKWHITWDRISTFLPSLKNELFRPATVPPATVSTVDKISDLSSKSSPNDDIHIIVIPKDILNEEAENHQETNIVVSSQPSVTTEHEKTYLASSNYSVILHPPVIPLISSSLIMTSDEKPSKKSIIADFTSTAVNTMPVLLDASAINEEGIPIIGCPQNSCK